MGHGAGTGSRRVHRILGGIAPAICILLVAFLVPPATAGPGGGGGPLPFTEEAATRGIVYNAFPNLGFGYGNAFADLDQDGDPDIVLMGGPGGIVGVYENDGTGNFIDRSALSGIPGGADISGVTAADYDGDGDLDLHFSYWFAPDVLVRNDGGFSFVDVTGTAGIAGASGAGGGCAWGDFDNDGWLDLFVSNRTGSVEGNPPGVDPNVPNYLFRNRGDGTFEEVSAAVGITSADRLTYQGVWFDYEHDGDADLYISNDKCSNGETNRLWVNQGGTFVEDSENTNANVCIDSMGVAVGDFDGNGEHDIYVTNTVEGNELLLGQTNGIFTPFGLQAGVISFAHGWGTFFFDYDNDGWQDIYVANQFAPNRLFDYNGSFPTASLAATLGVDDAGNGYGTSYADVDLDGDLDILVSNMPGPALLYINHEGETRNWVRFRVVGEGRNRFGIGARVSVRAGEPTMMREVTAGGSFKSQSELPLHFGLESSSGAGLVDVLWPGGATRVLTGLDANQVWTLYPPSALADADLDNDVDRLDFVRFVACHGPATPGSLVPGCEMMDLDGDADVDDTDYAAFLARYQGPIQDCNGNGSSDLQDLLDGVSVDLDQNGVADECDATAVPAGSVPVGGGAGFLTIEPGIGDEIQLSWPATCGPENDYQIYRGTLGSFGSHVPVLCSTGAATSWTLDHPLAPGEGSYFLIAPTNLSRQGSLGFGSNAVERSPGSAACLPTEAVGCP